MVELPALLTVQTGINEPGYATLRAIKQARDKPLDFASLDDLGLEASELVRATGSVRRQLAPIATRQAQMLEGNAGTVADQLATIIKERLD